MLVILGFIIVLIMVFGGFIVAGGKIEVVLHALPHEMIIIGGALLGSFLAGNKGNVIKQCGSDITLCIKGPKWKKENYIQLLTLMFIIVKTIKVKGILALEAHLDKPEESSIFNQFSAISHDHHIVAFICDILRLVTLNLEDPHQVEDVIQKQLDKHHHESMAASEAIQSMADSLPAIGIVAAVLGVIKTMSSIDQPPEVLGHMIGGALVGTFMGVFIAYCFVAPLANKIKAIQTQDSYFFMIIRDIIVAHLQGHAPQVSVEIGRGNVPEIFKPSFSDLEKAINDATAQIK